MHRYVAEGLLRDAADGQMVLAFAARDGAREIFQQVSALAQNTAGVARIIRSRGRECIKFDNGGRLRVISTSVAARGYQEDVVYVEGWYDLSERQRADIEPSAICGELIRG